MPYGTIFIWASIRTVHIVGIVAQPPACLQLDNQRSSIPRTRFLFVPHVTMNKAYTQTITSPLTSLRSRPQMILSYNCKHLFVNV